MKGLSRIRVLVPIVGLALGIGAGVALPRVAHELPAPLSAAARLPERLWTRFLPARLLAEAPRGAHGPRARGRVHPRQDTRRPDRLVVQPGR